MLQVGSSQCIGRLASINWAVKHWCHRISHMATWQWIVRVIAENSNKCETELSHNNKKHNQTFSHRNQRYTKHINKTMRFKTKITSFSYIFVATNQDALTIHKLKWKAPYPIAFSPFINTIVILGIFIFILKKYIGKKTPSSALVAVLVTWKNKWIFYLTFLIHI